jgi:RNA polymerase sigma factor (sigma-70 family)
VGPPGAWRDRGEERLVDRVRLGDERAFAEIVERYDAALMRYCRRLLSASEVEEAVQETFLRAYQGMRGTTADVSLKPWLYRIALNVSLDVLRRERAYRKSLREEGRAAEPPAQALERREDMLDVLRAIQALPPRQREALLLQAFEGRRYDDIATRLGISDQAVRQLLNRARTTLRGARQPALRAGWQHGERRRGHAADRRRAQGRGEARDGERRRRERRRQEHGSSPAGSPPAS